MENLRLFESVATILASIAASYGLVIFGSRLCRKLYQAWAVVGNLHREFGSSPVDELLTILGSIEARHGEIEIRQRLAERHLAFGVFVSTRDGQWTWANAWLCESFGIDSSALRDNGWVQAVRSNDRVEEYKHWMGCIKSSLHYERTFHVRPHNQKTEAWQACVEAWPVLDRGGEIICYVGYVVDAIRKQSREGENYGPDNDPTHHNL